MQIQSPNFLAAYGQGVQLREAERDIGNRNALTSAIQTGDMGAARNAFAAVNPEAAYTAMQPAKRDPKEAMAFAGQLTRAVLQADPEMRADVYLEALDLAQGTGLDISGLPREYNEQSVMVMDRLFNMPEQERTEFERLLERVPEADRPAALRQYFRLDPRPDAGANAPVTNVFTGDAPDTRPVVATPDKGYQRRWDAERNSWVDEPIPGSKPASEETEGQRKARLAQSTYENKNEFLLGQIDKAIEGADGFFNTGAPGAIMRRIPGTGAYDYEQLLTTIKANLGFAELQAMRDSSPTGGALGQVTERELAFLQAVEGSLDQAQSAPQLVEILTDLKRRKQEFAAERAAIMSMDNAPASSARGTPAGGETRSVGGKTYIKIDGEWFEQ